MKKYLNPEIEINVISLVDVLAVSTGYDNEIDNVFNWGDAETI